MRFAPALAALVVLAALAGCSPVSTEPEPPPPGRGWAQHILIRSEGDALAAAETAYRSFVSAGEAVLADGGSGLDRLTGHVTESWFERESGVYVEFAALDQRTVGSSVLVDMKVQSWSQSDVVVYACQDQSIVVVLDAAGRDVTPPDRPAIATFQVSFVAVGARLLLDRSVLWSHGESCF